MNYLFGKQVFLLISCAVVAHYLPILCVRYKFKIQKPKFKSHGSFIIELWHKGTMKENTKMDKIPTFLTVELAGSLAGGGFWD